MAGKHRLLICPALEPWSIREVSKVYLSLMDLGSSVERRWRRPPIESKSLTRDRLGQSNKQQA